MGVDGKGLQSPLRTKFTIGNLLHVALGGRMTLGTSVSERLSMCKCSCQEFIRQTLSRGHR